MPATFSQRNKGLARSIIDGVAQLTETSGKAIVVEDDLALHPYFLRYMNAALSRYAEDEHVYQVSGYMFDVPEFATRRSAVVLPLTTTWGWGTSARAWRQFEEASSGWQDLQRDHLLRKRFNLGGVYDYASMLEAQVAGRNSSWGIRWYWTVFRRGGMGIFPPQTLVRNCGMDGSGTHGSGLFRRFAHNITLESNVDIDLPEAVIAKDDVKFVCRAIYKQNGGAVGRLVDMVKRHVRT